MSRVPMDIGFELSNLCNLHCTHCIRGSHQPVLEHLDFSLRPAEGPVENVVIESIDHPTEN